MVVAKRPMPKMQVANALDPGLNADTDTAFVTPVRIAGAERFHIKQLFSDGLFWITPIISGALCLPI